MSKARKLQQEIDATLKKIHEGVELWSDEWKKLEATEVRGKEEVERLNFFQTLSVDRESVLYVCIATVER